MADFIAAITAVFALSFEFSETVDFTLGQLIIFSTVLGIGVSFARGLIRG